MTFGVGLYRQHCAPCRVREDARRLLLADLRGGGRDRFHYAPSRAHKHVEAFLGDFQGTLLSDGYAAYAAYERRRGLVHAQGWDHSRRNYVYAEESDPAGWRKYCR